MKYRTVLFLFASLMFNYGFSQISLDLTGPTNSCSGSSLRINSNYTGAVDSFYWGFDFDGNINVLSSSIDSISFNSGFTSGEDSLSLKVKLTLVDSQNQTTADSLLLYVHRKPQIGLIDNLARCCSYDTLNLDSVLVDGPHDFGGQWSVNRYSNYTSGSDFYVNEACLSNSNRFYLRYHYSDSRTGCRVIDSTLFTVHPLPYIKLDDPRFCQDLEIFDMEDRLVDLPGNTNNGIQSWKCVQCNGNDLNDLLIDKNGGTSTITDYSFRIGKQWYTGKNSVLDTVKLEYTFTNAFGCSNLDTATFYIVFLPEISFSNYRDLCWDEGEVDLNDEFGVTPDDGVWTVRNFTNSRPPSELGGISDSAVINTMNSPELESKDDFPNRFSMVYTHTATGCPTTRDTFLYIYPRPESEYSFNDTVICESSGPITLSRKYSNLEWSSKAPNVLLVDSFNYFITSEAPAGETTVLKYTQSDLFSGCSILDSINIQVDGKPYFELKDSSFGVVDTLSSITVYVASDSQEFVKNIQWDIISPNDTFETETGGITLLGLVFALDSSNPYQIFVEALVSSENSCPDTTVSSTITLTKFTLSIPDQEPQVLNVYPNPSKGNITILCESQLIGETLTVLSSEGKEVGSIQIKNLKNEIDISDLNKGLYTLVHAKSGTVIGKILLIE
ncbi:T9SS type A sorting domain-containing protein [bacterium]|nr:T9SS type A sorting domain-containing protein [bacterium]